MVSAKKHVPIVKKRTFYSLPLGIHQSPADGNRFETTRTPPTDRRDFVLWDTFESMDVLLEGLMGRPTDNR